MARPPVVSVVPGWNLWEESAACIDALARSDYPDHRIAYVDQGSCDGAVAHLRARFPELEVVALPSNVGFGAGANAGMARALALGAAYAFPINNDAIVAADAIGALVDVAEASRAGVAMPAIYYHEAPSVLWSAGARRRVFPPGVVFEGLGRPHGPPFDRERDIEYAPGCALLIARPVLERVGGFDPAYFMYYEDWDFCERVRSAGFRLRFAPRARVWHKVSRSSSGIPWLRWYPMGRSAARYYRRHVAPAIPSLLAYALWFTLREGARGQAIHLPLFWRGLADGLRGRPDAAARRGA